MSEQDKGTKRNVYFKSKKRYEVFKAICMHACAGAYY